MKLLCQFCIADMNLNLDTKLKIIMIANRTFYSSYEPLNSSLSMVHTHSAVAKYILLPNSSMSSCLSS